MSTQTFTASGTFTWPGGVDEIAIELLAAGAGAGGSFQIGPTNESGGAGGGGACVTSLLKGTPGMVYTVRVGTGGAGGASGLPGVAGGDSWFDNPSVVLAKGGLGGQPSGGAGGAGGNSIGCIGDVCTTGGSGGHGQTGAGSIGGAGGGSSAGPGVPGNNGDDAAGATGAAGGSAPAGGFEGGQGGTIGVGTGGSGPGTGGGSSSGDFTGKAATGQPGEIVLSWTPVSGPTPPPILRAPVTPLDDLSDRAMARLFYKPTFGDPISIPLIQPVRFLRPPAFDDTVFDVAHPQILFKPQLATRTPGPPVLVPWLSTRCHLELPDDGAAHPRMLGPPRLIDYGPRQASARGLHRIFNAAVYRFYRSNVAPPQESDVPFATSATLPNQPANLYADGVWYISVSRFNGVLDSGFLTLGPHGETNVRLEIAGGVAIAARPSGPMGARLEVRPGGVIRVIAFYGSFADGAAAASTWGIAYTVDGSTPAVGAASINQVMTAGPLRVISYDLPAQAGGTVVKVQLQTKRGSLYSLPSTVLSATAVVAGPTAPLNLGAWAGALPPSEES